jgi:hypothetical protein
MHSPKVRNTTKINIIQIYAYILLVGNSSVPGITEASIKEHKSDCDGKNRV